MYCRPSTAYVMGARVSNNIRSARLISRARRDVPLDILTSIEREISSETSPVGIDAKKTHIIILHKLQEIDERLRRIEARL